MSLRSSKTVFLTRHKRIRCSRKSGFPAAKGYLSSRPADPSKKLRGRPKNLLSMTPEGLKALERTVQNAVGLAELFVRHSDSRDEKDGKIRCGGCFKARFKHPGTVLPFRTLFLWKGKSGPDSFTPIYKGFDRARSNRRHGSEVRAARVCGDTEARNRGKTDSLRSGKIQFEIQFSN